MDSKQFDQRRDHRDTGYQHTAKANGQPMLKLPKVTFSGLSKLPDIVSERHLKLFHVALGSLSMLSQIAFGGVTKLFQVTLGGEVILDEIGLLFGQYLGLRVRHAGCGQPFDKFMSVEGNCAHGFHISRKRKSGNRPP